MTIKRQGYKRSTHMAEIKEQMKPVDEKEATQSQDENEQAGKEAYSGMVESSSSIPTKSTEEETQEASNKSKEPL